MLDLENHLLKIRESCAEPLRMPKLLLDKEGKLPQSMLDSLPKNNLEKMALIDWLEKENSKTKPKQ